LPVRTVFRSGFATWKTKAFDVPAKWADDERAEEASKPLGSLPQSTLGPPMLTPAEVAEHLRVSTETVYRWVRTGYLPGLRVGRCLRIRRDDVDALLARQGPPTR
jgi:excisionase family DNA binding protein